MAALYTRQNRFMTDRETGDGDGISSAGVREFANSINNCKGSIANPILISSVWPGASTDMQSTDASTAENLMHRYVARRVPGGYNLIHWSLGGLMKAGAAGDVAWRLYCSRGPYLGPLVFDTAYLASYDVSTITITSTTHEVPAGAIDLDLLKGADDLCYLALTAQSTVSGDYAYLTNLTARARIA